MTATSLLVVLDGWGHSDTPDHNAINAARTPNWDRLWQGPHTLISGSGIDVGLPAGQMGNSEVGHMNLGAGRVVHQDLTRIDRAIADGSFGANPVLRQAVDAVAHTAHALHVFGLLSPGGVHSHENQIAAAIEVAAARGARVFVHAFLDGRDTPPRSAEASLARIEALLRERGCGRIASIGGRYYAMDRDQRWERTALAYETLVTGDAEHRANDPIAALGAAYARDEGDEFVQPTIIAGAGEPAVRIEDGDAVLFMNFRADRARQLTRAFVEPAFSAFPRSRVPALAAFVTLTRYADDIDTPCIFAPETLRNSLGEYLADLGKRQLRIAETEKYAHVTFFFSGGREAPFPGEDRQLIGSPKVATYDLQPEMSAPEVTDTLVAAIRSGDYDVIVCNFANADMVGHTGVFDAAVAAVETIDACLGRIVAALDETGGQCLITADHGNVERMQDPHTGVPHTAHTSEPVPLIYHGPQAVRFDAGGLLSDVAPTLLDLMALPAPAEMTGRSLITREGIRQRA